MAKARVIDLTGEKFGRWTVIGCAGKDLKYQRYWKCKCECGTIRAVLEATLSREPKNGASYSCGCYAREVITKVASKFLTLNGHTMSIVGWARELGVRPETIRRRLARGLTLEQVLKRRGLRQRIAEGKRVKKCWRQSDQSNRREAVLNEH